MKPISDELRRRVMVLDGAMGTMIQRLGLNERHFRGSRFAAWKRDLKGCNDLLCLTRPDAIAEIHRAYVDAGADIIETNTFNANAISLADYGMEDAAYEINRTGAALAVDAAAGLAWVAGSMGPTNVSLSVPTGHGLTFDDLEAAYLTQARGLIDGGVDLLLIETVFDPINAKAAVKAARRAMDEAGREVPLMVSATLTESGRLLTGQSLAAFLATLENARPLSVGLNCGFGADMMLEHLRGLVDAPYFVSAHPNAGLPDEMGCYVETPEKTAADVRMMVEQGLVNIVGGCCGTTPAHVAAITAAVKGATPRPVKPDERTGLILSGMEAMEPREFLKVGERCNVAGSRKFLRLIKEGKTGEAVDIAAAQISAGADILDVNMDDGMLDARREMTEFLGALSADSRTAAVPVMIDSSDIEVITAALKVVQGRPIVNSISLKEGEESFLDHARTIRSLGAAVVVMAFDEKGQADTYERRIEICSRAYRLLTEKAGFRGRDIVFDPNVLTVATGIEAHNSYALDFLRATEWIKANLPGAKVSGGVSNLSFAFRGNNRLREAMHTLFIAHARRLGLDMAIVNPSAPLETDSIHPQLAAAIDDVLLNRRPDATERLLECAPLAESADAAPKPVQAPHVGRLSLEEMIVRGTADGIEEEIARELEAHGRAIAVIDGCLMAGMNRVGELFGRGEMFLPQVVRSASVMKRAVEILTPRIEAENAEVKSAAGKTMVLATVKGDVHDIGKNIVAVVMRCSGFRVIDLGVMVDAETILDRAEAENADFIGLSGLITPSLSEMARVAAKMQERDMTIPLFVGGATTSELHTAVKLAPLYSAGVIHTADAASLPRMARLVTDTDTRSATLAEIFCRQQQLRDAHQAPRTMEPDAARACGEQVDEPGPKTVAPDGVYDYEPTFGDLLPLINWRAFLGEWRMDPNGGTDEADRLIADARRELDSIGADGRVVKARLVLCPARRSSANDSIELCGGKLTVETPRCLVPNPVTGKCPALSDFVGEADDHVALFAVTAKLDIKGTTEYDDMIRQTLAHRIAEAATEWVNRRACAELWGLDSTVGIRPAVGYPSLPEQRLILQLDTLLKYSELGIELTEAGAMWPSATTSGLIIVHPRARYFAVSPLRNA